MIIIGEKINGAIPSAARAIENRDEAFIAGLVDAQVAAGADYLDVCAGASPDIEADTLAWLIDLVQSRTDTPICLDSPNPHLLVKLLPMVKHPGLVNSLSGESGKCAVLLPFLASNPEWKIIMLTCDDDGIPTEASKKVDIGSRLIEKAISCGIAQERVFIDPLVLSLSAIGTAMLGFMEAVQGIHAEFPNVHFTSGLSNISYGMPLRGLVNRNFLTLAMSAGMDSAIMDPTDQSMMETVYAASALLGLDKHCVKYNRAYRSGKIGVKK